MDKNQPEKSFFNHLPTAKQWHAIGTHPHHGIALALSSIRNPSSSGIGEYLDLIPLIDWCKSIGFDVIQLLPLNDSGADTSPYSAHSAMALHPIYLSLSHLPSVELFPALIEEIEKICQCNSSQRVNYSQVLHNKEQFLQHYFSLAYPLIHTWPAYISFVEHNSWVEDYALYKTFKNVYEEKPWWEWPDTIKDANPSTIEALKATYRKEIDFHIFVQFCCFDQWSIVRETADKEGLYLKGDIPILINRDSVDVWLHRALFMLDYAAGAPPDMYNEEGQYWGFPIYNWEAMEKAGYQWWQRRLQLAEKLYHIFRIDHIVGFFKIWAIPLDRPAKEGFFLPKDETLWIGQGEKILHMMISCCGMLPIGEDLGAVPPTVRECLQRLGICGTKVLRWERKWDGDQSFINTADYQPLSLSCVSTHDSETLTQWWNNHPDEARLFAASKGWNCPQKLDPELHRLILQECHSSGSLFHINLLQEYLGVFEELAWENPEDERINIPGLVLDRNWTYRFRPTLEEIITHKPLALLMKSLNR
ncbi:MAG: 4-alpha-glucanotransferase [Verrucomicrobia bacterium]|nr:4-alpha-glucanotransferase [Verrucomicrobiota bacterium]